MGGVLNICSGNVKKRNLRGDKIFSEECPENNIIPSVAGQKEINDKLVSKYEKGVEFLENKKYTIALKLFEQSRPYSCAILGFLYGQGIGCNRDLEKSLNAFRSAVMFVVENENENSEVNYSVTKHVYYLLLQVSNDLLAMKELKSALKILYLALTLDLRLDDQVCDRDENICLTIGYIFLLQNKPSMAISWFSNNSTCPRAKYFLYKTFSRGYGSLMKKNIKMSKYWYNKLANSNAVDLFRIGELLISGRSIFFKKNQEESIKFLNLSLQKSKNDKNLQKINTLAQLRLDIIILDKCEEDFQKNITQYQENGILCDIIVELE